MLTKKQLKQLRSEIVLNSLFTKDYKNTLFIKPETVCSFFDGFIENIEELYHDKHNKNADSYNDLFNEYDNINELWNYYTSLEYDPLLQDDFIASKPINNSDGIVIYEINDNYIYSSVSVAYFYLSGLYMKNTKIKTLKLYESVKRGSYFILNKKREYLDEYIKNQKGDFENE